MQFLVATCEVILSRTMTSASAIADFRLPLDGFPLLRSSDVGDVCTRMGRLFSPHRLEVRGDPHALQVQLNQVALRDVSVHVLRYGTEVTIDPGRRGDFYMVQLPLAGHAELHAGAKKMTLDANVLSILHPQAPTLMHWSADCTMILLQISRQAVQRRLPKLHASQMPTFALAASRNDPGVGAWWSMAEDMVRNLDQHASQWLAHPAAGAAMEEFLLTAFTTLLQPLETASGPTPGGRADQRCLQRAKEYIHARLDEALLLDDIAGHACVCPRTLETVFKRHESMSPLTYARHVRMHAVHEALQRGPVRSVTDVALSYGFNHMGRFAAQYRQQFGCSPSETVRTAR
jgi:AraC-like DNA-binding protein